MQATEVAVVEDAGDGGTGGAEQSRRTLLLPRRRDLWTEAPSYGRLDPRFSVAFHHGGFFCGLGQNRTYLDETVDIFDEVDRSFFQCAFIDKMVADLGYSRADQRLKVYWCKPGHTVGDGLVAIRPEMHANQMKEAAVEEKLLHLFIDHVDLLGKQRADECDQPSSKLSAIVSPSKAVYKNKIIDLVDEHIHADFVACGEEDGGEEQFDSDGGDIMSCCSAARQAQVDAAARQAQVDNAGNEVEAPAVRRPKRRRRRRTVYEQVSLPNYTRGPTQVDEFGDADTPEMHEHIDHIDLDPQLDPTNLNDSMINELRDEVPVGLQPPVETFPDESAFVASYRSTIPAARLTTATSSGMAILRRGRGRPRGARAAGRAGAGAATVAVPSTAARAAPSARGTRGSRLGNTGRGRHAAPTEGSTVPTRNRGEWLLFGEGGARGSQAEEMNASQAAPTDLSQP